VLEARFTPDGQSVVTASMDSTVRSWSASTGLELHRVQAEGSVKSVDVSPDGAHAAVGALGMGVWIADLATGARVRSFEGHSLEVSTVLFDAAGGRIVTASSDASAIVWNAQNGRQSFALEGHRGPLTSAVFGGNDHLIVTTSRDRTVRVWDAVTGQILQVLTFPQEPTYATFVGDERLVVVGNDGHATVWEATTDRRTPAELAALVACRVALRINQGRVVPVGVSMCRK
jgi:WD40 repeat protein